MCAEYRQPVRGTYLVALRRDDDPEAVGQEAALLYRGRVRHVYRAARGFAIRLPDAAAQVLAAIPASRSSRRTAWSPPQLCSKRCLRGGWIR